MAMGVPVVPRFLDGVLELPQRLEEAPGQRQGPGRLPPRLDEVEVGGVLGLEDELPARVGYGQGFPGGRDEGAEDVPAELAVPIQPELPPGPGPLGPFAISDQLHARV